MEKVVVLDFGGQYTQLIAKRVRESEVFSEIVASDISLEELKKHQPAGIILSGGPASVQAEGAPLIDQGILELGVPVLGICYGMQVMAYLLDGRLSGEGIKEYGETSVSMEYSPLSARIDKRQLSVWMSHGDSVTQLPPGFESLAHTDHHIAAMGDMQRHLYGVQFHPEVTHTEHGTDIIDSFVHDICGIGHEWTAAHFIEESKDYVRETVGKNNVICFVSGGVDSSFVAALLSHTEGIGTVYPIYIEGLMRKNETEEVITSLEQAGVDNLKVYRGEDEFIREVKGIRDPETKRKAIGNLFGRLQERLAAELELEPENTYLAQGTLYTDLIESGRGAKKSASNIKSHHNVGCEFIERLRADNRLVEPNRWIFKDEVRQAAREIGLPETICARQPYPGPGLGIRIVCGEETWQEQARTETPAVDAIAQKHGLRAVVAPVKTVGVQGDERTYRFVAVLRGPPEWGRIREAAKEIPMQCPSVNRVVYQMGNSQTEPAAIPSTVSRETVDQLKEIDARGRDIIQQHGIEGISQTIFVLFGADLDGSSRRSVALRAVITDDFMTVRPARPGEELPWQCLEELADMVSGHAGSFVIDVTDKPPATTCWE